MGLKIDYFYSLTPRNFYNISEGYRRKEEESLKIKMILNRDLEFAMISPYLDKKANIKSVTDYKKFDWENEDEVDPERVLKTKEELAAIKQKMQPENK